MKRLLFGILCASLCFSLFVRTVEAKPPQKKASEAKPSKASTKNKRGKQKAKGAANTKISPALGEVKWGMDEETVLAILIKNVRERYRPLIAKTKDPVEDDRLRLKERAEIEQLKKSLVRFDGQSTGWDLGFLRDEFTHNNGETMLVVKDSNSQNFYFFIGGKLWKWYKALDSTVFAGKTFDDFSLAVQRKFGEAKQIEGELYPGTDKRQWLEWEDKKTRLRAIDQTSFYGFYCLVFEDKKTSSMLASLRANPSKREVKKHALVEAVTAESGLSASPDETPDIVDRITGRLRRRQDEQETGAESRPARAVSSPSSTVEDDPLSGLD